MTDKDIIKKFTDMLKDQFDLYGVDYTAYAIVDNVAKEMGVEDNGKT